MTSKVTILIEEARKAGLDGTIIAEADAELQRWAKQRADFVDRVRQLEQKDRDSERFCKELVIKCGDALHAAADRPGEKGEQR